MWVKTIGRFASAAGCETEGREEGHLDRFAGHWSDWMLPYDSALSITWTNAALKNPYYLPGSTIVWFEDSFSSVISGVDFSVDPKGEFIVPNCTLRSGVYTIYNSNTQSGGHITPTIAPNWYAEFDNWRPGTPLLLTDCDNPVNNGFYRVRSRRMGTGAAANVLYLAVDNNNYEQQELAQCVSGTIKCNPDNSWGGDWWTMRGADGNCDSSMMLDGGKTNQKISKLSSDTIYNTNARDRWWTVKDGYHRYAGNQRGPYDGRPPSGGQYAIDYNHDWIRAANTNLYHHYDTNARRYVIDTHTNGGPENLLTWEQWTGIIPSRDFLCFQSDPKEQEPPYYFLDSKSIRWKIGSKVAIRAGQITNPAMLGAIQQVIECGYRTSSGYIGASSDRQYGSVYEIPGVVGQTGTLSFAGTLPDAEGLMQKMINHKFDAALQNMVELVAEEAGWCLPIDNEYRYNWLMQHWDDRCTDALAYYLGHYGYDYPPTYGELYQEHGLDAYNPYIDSNQCQFAKMSDPLWGENSSAFELVLKKLGVNYYDWYYDDQYPYMPKYLLDYRWKWVAQQNPDYYPMTWQGKLYQTPQDVMDDLVPMPHGTWRRSWKRTLGYVREGKMRSGALSEPVGDDYRNYSSYPEDANKHFFIPSRIRMAAPEESEYAADNNDLVLNHAPAYVINGTEVYNQRVWRIIQDCKDALNILEYQKGGEISIQAKTNSQSLPNKSNMPSLEAAFAYAESLDSIWIDNPDDWIGTPSSLPYSAEYGCEYTYNYANHTWTAGPGRGGFAWRHNLGALDSNAVSVSIAIGVCLRFGEIAPCLTQDVPVISDRVLVEGVSTSVEVSGYWRQGANPYCPIHWVFHRSEVHSGNSSYREIRPLGGWRFAFLAYGDPNNRICCSKVDIHLHPTESEYLFRFNYHKYSDAVWTRSVERADVYLIDRFGPDTNPPVVRNEWWQLPVVYDKNFPIGAELMTDYEILKQPWRWPYNQPDYIPIIAVKGECCLMEDLEGNGVFYIFDAELGDLADLMDREIEQRLYDYILDQNVDSSPGGPNDAWTAYDEWLRTGGIQLNSRDNASSAGGDDNYNVPLSLQSIQVLLPLPMFPVKARLVQAATSNPCAVNIDYGGGIVQHWWLVVVDTPIMPTGNGYRYEFEIYNDSQSIQLLREFHSQEAYWQTSFPAGVVEDDLPQPFRGRAYLWTNCTASQPSWYSVRTKFWRMLYRNLTTNRTGMRCNAVEAKSTITITV